MIVHKSRAGVTNTNSCVLASSRTEDRQIVGRQSSKGEPRRNCAPRSPTRFECAYVGHSEGPRDVHPASCCDHRMRPADNR